MLKIFYSPIMKKSIQDMGKDIPAPGSAECVPEENEIVTCVDVDFAEYRRVCLY